MWIESFFQNEVLMAAVFGWLIAQIIKFLIVVIEDRRINFERLVGSGGMPSAHSSFMMALTTSVVINEGPDSVAFAICFVISFVVMYDATGVRRAAGEQATLLNQLVENLGREKLQVTGKRLKELIGHTHMQVIAGAILGITTGIATHFIF